MATALTRGGSPWTPRYLDSIDFEACIGCGRCYKVCGQGVLEPIDKPIDDDEDEDEACGGTVMSVGEPLACIGCQACMRVCAKRAHVHVEV